MYNITSLKKIRISNGLSQEDMSNILWMSRITYVNIESWRRWLKLNEIQILSENFEIDMSLFNQTEETINEWINSIENVILYILSKCAGKPNLGKIVMNKLLYFIDFNYHEKYHESLTWTTYIKMPMGPVPKNIDTILCKMEKKNLLTIDQWTYFWYNQTRLIPKAKPDMQNLTIQKLTEIDYVINQYGDKTGKRLTDFSHGDAPWRLTPKIWDEISYNHAHYRNPIYRVTTDEEDGD